MIEEINKKCPICEIGNTVESSERKFFDYKDRKIVSTLFFDRCDFCQIETTSEEQSLFNRRELNREKKKIDGIPLGSEIRSARINLWKINQKEAAFLLGGGPTAFSKYENDDLVPDSSMSTLLNLLIEHPTILEKIKNQKKLNQYRDLREFSSESQKYEEEFLDDHIDDVFFEEDTLSINTEFNEERDEKWPMKN